MRKSLHNYYWLTLTELVVSVTISTLLLWGVFYFITEVLEGLGRNASKSEFLWNFYEFSRELSNWDFEILPLDWYSIGLLRYNNMDEWLLLWVVNLDNRRIIPTSESNIYNQSVIGARRLSDVELDTVIANQSAIYDLEFQHDELFPTFYIYDFQLLSYNNWDIHELVFEIFYNFVDDLEWIEKTEAPITDREIYSIIF